MNKLKRYTMGRVTLAKTENASLQGAGIVECENGEFYRCADIDPLLESIGAGGVSGRLIKKSTEEQWAEFLDWFTKNVKPKLQPDYDDAYFYHKPEFMAWLAWKAARGITE